MHAYLAARRARAAAAWGLKDEIVLVGAGEPIGIPGGADQTYPFLAHAEYVWLADRDTAGAVVAFDPADGWRDFVPDVTEREKLWEGREQEWGDSLNELPGWLAKRRGRPVVQLGVPLAGLASDPLRTNELRELLSHARRPKDPIELERMRLAAAASAAGYAKVKERIRPGVSERQLQIELEAEFFRHGGDGTAYESIVASGPRSAILHSPSSGRVLGSGELLLIDAGASVKRYASDVTRTYAVTGAFDALQRDLYAIVLRAEERACEACVVNAPWRDLHLTAARDMVEGLVSLGIMKGKPDSLVERSAHTLFFPHGLGHLLGLGVRDASGRLPGDRAERPAMLSTLRTDLPLGEDYVITVEPGIYFVPALLENRERRETFKDAVNWERADALKGFGGIRIEDNVRITPQGPEILTAAIPKGL